MAMSKPMQALLASLGSTASVVGAASSAAMVAGLVYLVDCRLQARSADEVEMCYLRALPIAGIGVAGRGGYAAGYATYNPALRRPEREEETALHLSRDAHGRFQRRERD